MATHRDIKLPPVTNRTFVQSWLALPARTRTVFSLGVCAVGLAGIAISDYLEKKIPDPQNQPPVN